LTIQTDRESNVAARDQAISVIIKQYDPEIAQLDGSEKDLTLQLQSYYMENLGEVEKDGRKSVQLTHGILGRRLTPPALKLANKSWTWSAVLASVQTMLGKKYITFADPKLDKEAIKKADLPADDLRKCGLVIDQDEAFYAETFRPKESR
jgi:phage host-nuclease inhibitor protein Gam